MAQHPTSHSTKPDSICLAVIAAAQGIKGQVRLKAFLEDPADLVSYETFDQNGDSLLVESIDQMSGEKIVARIQGVTDRNAAEALKGRQLWVERRVLPELDQDTSFYHEDLVGLNVLTQDEETVGTVNAVYNFGAGDILEIDQDGQLEMFLFTRENFPTVDMKKGMITFVRPAEVIVEEGKE